MHKQIQCPTQCVPLANQLEHHCLSAHGDGNSRQGLQDALERAQFALLELHNDSHARRGTDTRQSIHGDWRMLHASCGSPEGTSAAQAASITNATEPRSKVEGACIFCDPVRTRMTRNAREKVLWHV